MRLPELIHDDLVFILCQVELEQCAYNANVGRL
jgi:hypothetical protein